MLSGLWLGGCLFATGKACMCAGAAAVGIPVGTEAVPQVLLDALYFCLLQSALNLKSQPGTPRHVLPHGPPVNAESKHAESRCTGIKWPDCWRSYNLISDQAKAAPCPPTHFAHKKLSAGCIHNLDMLESNCSIQQHQCNGSLAKY